MKGAIMRVVYTSTIFTVFTYEGVYTVFTVFTYEGVYTVFTVFTYEGLYTVFTVFTHEGIYAFNPEEYWRTKDWRRTFREEISVTRCVPCHRETFLVSQGRIVLNY